MRVAPRELSSLRPFSGWGFFVAHVSRGNAVGGSDMATTSIQSRSPIRTRGALTPSLDELRNWLDSAIKRPSTTPVFREIMADVETPVSAYLKIREPGASGFILESVEGGERIARYSFIGSGSMAEITLRDNLAEINGTAHKTLLPYDD